MQFQSEVDNIHYQKKCKFLLSVFLGVFYNNITSRNFDALTTYGPLAQKTFKFTSADVHDWDSEMRLLNENITYNIKIETLLTSYPSCTVR